MPKSWLEWRLLRPDGTPAIACADTSKVRLEEAHRFLVEKGHYAVRVRVTAHEPKKQKGRK